VIGLLTIQKRTQHQLYTVAELKYCKTVLTQRYEAFNQGLGREFMNVEAILPL